MATATDEKIKAKKIKEAGCVVTLQVEIPAAKVQETTQNVWVRLQSQVRLPGFRPGKAPLPLVQSQFAGQARQRVLDNLIEKAVPDAISALDLTPVAIPGVHDLSMEPGKPLAFQVDVEVSPKVELKAWKKLPAVRRAYPVDDAEVDKRVEDLREGNARLERSLQEELAQPHYAVIDYEGSMDGKPMRDAKGTDELVDMSSAQSVEGLVEGMLGAKRGETRDIAVKVEGKPASFKVSLKEIKTKVLPRIDDEFAKDLGFQTVLELRVKLREMIEAEGKRRSDREVSSQLEQGLLKANPFAVPPSLVAGRLEALVERLKGELLGPNREWPEGELPKLREKLAPKASDEVRLSYILAGISTAEKITATDADVEAELQKSLEAAGDDKEKEDVRRFFAERREHVAALVRERKVMAAVRDAAVIQDEKAK